MLGCWALKVPKRGEDVEVVLAKGALHLTLETPNGKGARAVPQVILLQRSKHCLLVFMRQHLEPEEIILQATDVSLRTWTYGADIGITWSPFGYLNQWIRTRKVIREHVFWQKTLDLGSGNLQETPSRRLQFIAEVEEGPRKQGVRRNHKDCTFTVLVPHGPAVGSSE